MEKDLKNKILAFYSTFEYCGNFVLQLSDEDIELTIFEDYDWGNFLDEPLFYLLKAKVINENIVKKAQRIRHLSEEIFSLDNKIEFSANYVKTSKEWKEIFNLADEIKDFLETSSYLKIALNDSEN